MQHCIPRAPLHHLLPLCHTVACRKLLVALWVAKASPPPQGYQLSWVSAASRDPIQGQEGLPRTPSAEVGGANTAVQGAQGAGGDLLGCGHCRTRPHEAAQHEPRAALLPPPLREQQDGWGCPVPPPLPVSPRLIAATCCLSVTSMAAGWAGACSPPHPPRPQDTAQVCLVHRERQFISVS